MSRNWLLWGPLALFVAGWAVLGLRYGYLANTQDESDVISHYAAQYLDERAQAGDAQAKASDCAAQPGTVQGIWLVVTCTHLDQRYEYHVNQIGGLVHRGAPDAGTQSDPDRPST